MFSELMVKSGGTIVPIKQYTLLTLPYADMGTLQIDDGLKLTDGMVSNSMDNGVARWDATEGEKTLTVNMEEAKNISRITLHAIGGGVNEVFAPKQVAFYTSLDGNSWIAVKTIKKDVLIQDGSRQFDVTYDVKLSDVTKAQYLRAVVTLGQGMCALSDISAS